MNSPLEFHWSQKLMHWLMAIMVIAMLFIGIGMVNTISDLHSLLLHLHKPLGIVILLLVIVRLFLRRRYGAPPLPDHMSNWQKRIAKMSHALFYILLLAQPVCGILIGMLGATPIQNVTSGRVPYPVSFSFVRDLHSILAYLLFGLILVHLTAALIHRFIYRDGVFGSMTFSKKSED